MNASPATSAGFLRCAAPRERALLALLSFAYFLTSTDSQMMAPLLPAIRGALGGVNDRVALLVPVYGIATAITSVAVGAMIDRFGAGLALRVGFTAFVAGALLAAASPGLALLAVGRAASGIGAAMLSLGAMLIINRVFGESRRAPAFGYFVAGAALSAVLGLPAAALGESAAGWRAPFFGLSILGAAVFILLLVLEPARASNTSLSAPPPPVPPTTNVYRCIFTDRRLLCVLSLGFLFNVAIFMMLPLLGLWLADRFDLSTPQIFGYYVLAGLGAVVAGPFGGRLADRFGALRMIAFANIGLIFFLPLVARASNPGMLKLLIFLATAVNVLRLVPYHVLTLQVASPEFHGRFVGLRNAVSQFGIFAGASIGGALYATKTMDFSGIGLLAAAICVLPLPILRAIARDRTENAATRA